MFGNFNNYGTNNQSSPLNPLNLNWNPTYPSQQPSGNFYYINGIEGAKAFLVQPNQRVVLFDSDSQTFFIKVANAQGQATLKEFEFQEKVYTPPKEQTSINTDDFISRKEFEEFKAKITAPKPTIQKQVIATKSEVGGTAK